MSETKREYAANYRKPPVHTRFKKGQSGNPRGRPAKNLAALLAAALNEKVTVTENGKRRQVTKREAVIAQLVNKSASAELRAPKMLIDMLRDIEKRAEPAMAEKNPFSPTDKEVVQQLTAWFWAAYLMATHSNGISALQLQRQLAFGSYKTAWLICAKLRCSMLAPGRSPLAGLVEVDETEIVCRSKNDPVTGGGGRSHQGKMLVVGAVEVEDGGLGPGRIRLSQVPDYSAASLHAFLAANLGPGATAKTDGWSGYPGAAGITHDPHVVGKMAAHIVLPWVHRIFSNLKVWALGVYHGLRRKHLQSYLDEFVFRFNRLRTRHAAFRSLLGIAAAQPPRPYKMLISPESRRCCARVHATPFW
jgi:ISXO2-like transposase domain/Family of unknown function (DUF5681)